MALLCVSCLIPPSWKARNICIFLICFLYTVSTHPWFVMMMFCQGYPALVVYFKARQSTSQRRGSITSSIALNEGASLQPKPFKDGTKIASLLSKDTKGIQEQEDPSVLDFGDKSVSQCTREECSPTRALYLRNEDVNRWESTEFSALGIDDIMSVLQVVDHQERVLTATGEERKEINGLFLGSGFSSLWSVGESKVPSWEGTIDTSTTTESMNLHALANGKVTKKPMEHDEQEKSGLDTSSNKQVKVPAEGPSDGETPESTAGASNQNGGRKVSSTGRGPGSGLCQRERTGRPNSAGSSGSGGDDGGDDRRPNIPTGGCRSDGQPVVDRGKKGKREEGGDADDSDGGNGDGDGNNDGDGDGSGDGNGDGNKDSDSDGDGDGDGDGDEEAAEEKKKKNLTKLTGSPTNLSTLPCESRESLACQVTESPSSCNDDTGHKSHTIPPNPAAISSVDVPKKKSTDQGLKVDVESARRFSQAVMTSFGSQVQPYLGDQSTVHRPDVLFYKEEERRLYNAFSCRHNMRAWKQCSDKSCLEIQQLLMHTQNCHMHVLGGCRVCIQHRNTLMFHVTRCQWPTGKCVFEKCGDIRRYLEKNELPDDKSWTYSHDQLFFKPSSPKTPTLLGSPVSREIQRSLSHTHNCRKRVLGGCEVCIDYKDTMLAHAYSCERPLGTCGIRRCDDIRKYMKTNSLPDNGKWTLEFDQFFFGNSPLATPNLLNINGSTMPVAESSLFRTQGIWNQYHVDRPPDYIDLSANRDQPGACAHPTSSSQPSDLHVPVASEQLVDDTFSLPVSQERSSDHQEVVTEAQQSDATVSRGPTADVEVIVDQNEQNDQTTTPLSARHITNAGHAVRSNTPRQEVLWPLNKEHLSVGGDGSYLANVHWTRDAYIGGGSCGRCYLCSDLTTGKLFAIKRIPEDKYDSTELQIWGALSGRHPNILEFYGAVKSQGKVTIFMEYMEGGSVKDVGKMHETLACCIIEKVLLALDFMHREGFLHRDIKGANILLDETGQKVKLADFGTSIKLCNGYQQDNIPRGTEPFMAPEVCRSQPHSFSAESWSLMCLLYQMIKGTPPWEAYHHCHRLTLLYQIATASQPPPSPPCSPELEDLFSQGFQLEPSHRATVRELLNHKVFATAPDMSNMALPVYSTGYDPDYESSVSSLISSTARSVTSDEGANNNDGGDVDNGEDEDEEISADDSASDDDGDDDDDWAGGSLDYQSRVYGSDDQQWQGTGQPGFDGLSAEEQLQSLQSDLFHSLPAEELEKMVLGESSGVTENDINLMTCQEDFDLNSFLDQISLDPNVPSHPDGSYSVSDLTKVHIRGSDGYVLFSIRERPTTTFGSLAKDLHGNIASLLAIDAFALTRDDGSPLDVHAEIGGEQQGVRVVRAHDTDNWQPYRWRVDVHGLVEQTTRV